MAKMRAKPKDYRGLVLPFDSKLASELGVTIPAISLYPEDKVILMKLGLMFKNKIDDELEWIAEDPKEFEVIVKIVRAKSE